MQLQEQPLLSNGQIAEFISSHKLPGKFQQLVDDYYLQLASWIMRKRRPGEALFVGINGGQGTGKSTLADLLKLALESGANWRVAILSIDDFYLTKTQRQQLAKLVHPLLATRGVPGTHDVQLLTNCIDDLKSLDTDATLSLPRFDKSTDDRANAKDWPSVSGPIDLIVLEGWCVGSKPQSKDALLPAINMLEEQQDASGEWRHYVDDKLEREYSDLFARLDALIFLKVPNFDAVYRWRLEQEQKLSKTTSHEAAEIMSGDQILHFIQHYERLTTADLKALPEIADVTLELDDDHDCVRMYYKTQR